MARKWAPEDSAYDESSARRPAREASRYQPHSRRDQRWNGRTGGLDIVVLAPWTMSARSNSSLQSADSHLVTAACDAQRDTAHHSAIPAQRSRVAKAMSAATNPDTPDPPIGDPESRNAQRM
jgi:hypothetical protein